MHWYAAIFEYAQAFVDERVAATPGPRGEQRGEVGVFHDNLSISASGLHQVVLPIALRLRLTQVAQQPPNGVSEHVAPIAEVVIDRRRRHIQGASQFTN